MALQFAELGLVILWILCPVRRTGPSTNQKIIAKTKTKTKKMMKTKTKLKRKNNWKTKTKTKK